MSHLKIVECCHWDEARKTSCLLAAAVESDLLKASRTRYKMADVVSSSFYHRLYQQFALTSMLRFQKTLEHKDFFVYTAACEIVSK